MTCKDCLSYSICTDEDKGCSICEAFEKRPCPPPKLSPYEKTKAQVEATGNKWAIENFHATHD